MGISFSTVQPSTSVPLPSSDRGGAPSLSVEPEVKVGKNITPKGTEGRIRRNLLSTLGRSNNQDPAKGSKPDDEPISLEIHALGPKKYPTITIDLKISPNSESALLGLNRMGLPEGTRTTLANNIEVMEHFQKDKTIRGRMTFKKMNKKFIEAHSHIFSNPDFSAFAKKMIEIKATIRHGKSVTPSAADDGSMATSAAPKTQPRNAAGETPPNRDFDKILDEVGMHAVNLRRKTA